MFRAGLLAALSFLSVQGHAQKALATGAPEGGDATVAGEIPEGYVARGSTHRLLVPANHPLLARARENRLVRSVEDYGSFAQVVIDLPGAGELERLLARGARLADELTLMSFNGFLLDGADERRTADALDRKSVV